MPFLIGSDAKRLSRWLAAGVCSLLLLFMSSPPAGAVNNDVSVAVCGPDASGASLVITEPNDDSVLNQATTTLRGSVSSASQIEVMVNGAYSDTIALGANQSSFSYALTLVQGTNTITLTANDICQVADATDTIVLTYEAVQEPSHGGSIPTDVPSGVVIGPEPGPPSELPDKRPDNRPLPIINEIEDVVRDIPRRIGLEHTVAGESVAVAASRIVLTITALSAVVLAPVLAPVALQTIPGLSVWFNPSSLRSARYLTWSLRGAGVLLLAVAYLL